MDLLDVKISHISFKVTGPKEILDVFNSPNYGAANYFTRSRGEGLYEGAEHRAPI
jgi:hypothetical protein